MKFNLLIILLLPILSFSNNKALIVKKENVNILHIDKEKHFNESGFYLKPYGFYNINYNNKLLYAQIKKIKTNSVVFSNYVHKWGQNERLINENIEIPFSNLKLIFKNYREKFIIDNNSYQFKVIDTENSYGIFKIDTNIIIADSKSKYYYGCYFNAQKPSYIYLNNKNKAKPFINYENSHFTLNEYKSWWKKPKFVLWPTWTDAEEINGLGFGFWNRKTDVNGVSFSAVDLGLVYFALLLLDKTKDKQDEFETEQYQQSKSEELDPHEDVLKFNFETEIKGLNFGLFGDSFRKKVKGVNFTFFHSNRIGVDGLSFNLVGNIGGYVNGVNLGLICNATEVNGLNLSLMSYNKNFRGLSLSLINKTKSFYGLQIGIFNYTNALKGFQFGLINVNSERIMPIFNW
jgi:hypothetical protein